MTQRLVYTLTICYLLAIGLTAQPYLISGIVMDDADAPLIGASVLEKGTVNATVTDFDGRFELYVSDTTATLLISYTGYETHAIDLGARPAGELHIKVTGKPVTLDEMVVTGAGRERSEKRRRYDAAPPPPSAPPPPTMSIMSHEAMDGRSTMAARAVYGGAQAASAGTLTAGEVNDFNKWELWQDIAEEDLMLWREHWLIHPAQRYAVQLTTEYGAAVVNCPVRLTDASGNTLWVTRTDNTGKAELWAGLFGENQQTWSNLRIVVAHPQYSHTIYSPTRFQQGINFVDLPVSCRDERAVDILFVVDATGSMQDEINYLKAELQDVIQRVKDTLPQSDLQLGSLFYRDQGEAYLTKHSQLSKDIDKTTSFIARQGAEGGGDTPEAVEVALEEAVYNMNWRPEAATRLLFLVLDAPPHHNAKVMASLERTTRRAAELGIRIIPLACSGIDKSTEYLMRSLALATNGTYTFLTDDSGVGFSHIEPTTDSYDVEKLNALLARVIYQFAYTPDCASRRPIAASVSLDTTQLLAMFDPTDEVEAEAATYRLRFYPNPSSGPLTIESEGVEMVFLADISGKLLERFPLTDLRSRIDIGRYPAGAYLLGFHTPDDEWRGEQLVLVRR